MSSLLFHSLSLRSSIGSVGKRFGGGKRFMAIVPFKLSDIGEGIAEVEVLKWHVKVGDRVSQFDKLLEVQSDKATVDITSRFDGVVTQLHYKVRRAMAIGASDRVQPSDSAHNNVSHKPSCTLLLSLAFLPKIGDMARTGTALVDLEVKDSKAESLLPAAPDSSTAAAALPDSATSKSAMNDARGLRSLATPAVRRIAREQGVSVSSVTGTGKAGRVTKDDMLRYSDNNASIGTGMGNAAGGTTNTSPRVSASKREDEVIPLRGLARAMAKSMTASWAIPHFGFADEVVVDELVAARTALSPLASSRGVKLTYLPFLVKAASLALLTAPNLNARVITGSDGDSLILRGSHNFGIAMDSPRGLIVPVIQDVAGLTVLEISEEIARLSALAKEGRLGESDLSGISFTCVHRTRT